VVKFLALLAEVFPIRITCPKVAKVCYNPTNISLFLSPCMLIEMEEDKTLDGRHAIEEAMSAFFLDHLAHRFHSPRVFSIPAPFTFSKPPILSLTAIGSNVARALMRNCPQCQKRTSFNSLHTKSLHDSIPFSIYQGTWSELDNTSLGFR
jgi:hypothetical protein